MHADFAKLCVFLSTLNRCSTHKTMFYASNSENNKWVWIQRVKWSNLRFFGLEVWTSSLHLDDFKFCLTKQNVGKMRNICWNSSNHVENTHHDVYRKIFWNMGVKGHLYNLLNRKYGKINANPSQILMSEEQWILDFLYKNIGAYRFYPISVQ